MTKKFPPPEAARQLVTVSDSKLNAPLKVVIYDY